MLLAIDVGNTETVIGLYTGDDTETVPVVEDGVGVGIGTEVDPSAPRDLNITGGSRRSRPAPRTSMPSCSPSCSIWRVSTSRRP